MSVCESGRKSIGKKDAYRMSEGVTGVKNEKRGVIRG